MPLSPELRQPHVRSSALYSMPSSPRARGTSTPPCPTPSALVTAYTHSAALPLGLRRPQASSATSTQDYDPHRFVAQLFTQHHDAVRPVPPPSPALRGPQARNPTLAQSPRRLVQRGTTDVPSLVPGGCPSPRRLPRGTAPYSPASCRAATEDPFAAPLTLEDAYTTGRKTSHPRCRDASHIRGHDASYT